jgi:hypothetical protein
MAQTVDELVARAQTLSAPVEARGSWLAAGRAAQAAGDDRAVVTCARAVPVWGGFLDDDADVRALVAAGLRRASGPDARWLRARLVQLLPWTQARLRQEMAVALVAETRGDNDPRLEIAAVFAWLDAFWGPGHLNDRLDEADRALSVALLNGLLDLEFAARCWRTHILLEAARVAEAAAELTLCQALAARGGQPDSELAVAVRQGCFALLEGDYSGADAALADATRLVRIVAAPDGPHVLDAQRGVRAFQQADEAAAAALWEDMNTSRLGRLDRAGIAAHAGDIAVASELLAVGVRDIAFMVGPRAVPSLALGAYAAYRVGDAVAAATLVEPLRPLRGRLVVIGGAAASLGPVDLYIACAEYAMGNASAGDAALSTAQSLARAIGARPWIDRARAVRSARTPPSAGTRLMPSGLGWVLESDGRAVPLGAGKGFAHLAMLLANPGRRIHVTELVGIAAGGATTTPRLDATALRQYRERIREIEAEQDAADRRGEQAASARLAKERLAIEGQLRQARGRGGRLRPLGSDVERMRVNVTRTIKHALARIAEADPATAAELAARLRTGTHCVYEIEP